LAGDREKCAVCDNGLATFEQQHIDVAVAKCMCKDQPGTKKNVQFATTGWQHLNSNILMWQWRSVCAKINSATNHPQNSAAGIRLLSMWPYLYLNLRNEEPHARQHKETC